MKKKLIPIIVSIAVVAALAAATGIFMANRAAETGEEDEFLPGASQVDVSKLKDAKLTIYFEAQANEAMKEVLEAVNEKLHPELKTVLAFELIAENPDNYYERIKGVIAAGKPCDAFYYSSYFPVTLSQLAKSGLAADITNDFPKYAPNYFGKFSTAERKAITVNGRLYAVPCRIPTAVKKCVVVRDDLMARYNIPDITNYNDYEVYLDTIKKNEPQMIPMNYWDTTIGLFSEVNGYVVLDYQMGLVYKWGDPSMKLMAWEQTPEFADCLNRIKSWYDKEYLLKDVGIAQIDENILTSGKWASFITNWGNEFGFNSLLAMKGFKDFKYKAYPIYGGDSARNSPLEAALAINPKSKQTDRVLMFVNWLQSGQENYDLLMYGVKGKHYIDMGDYIVPPEGVSETESFLNWNWKAPFRNIEYERANFPGLKEEVERYKTVMEEKTKFPPHMGFVPDYSAFEDISAMRQYGYYQLDQKIYNGTFMQEDIDTFIQDQKNSGVNNLVDGIQKQLDKFIKGR